MKKIAEMVKGNFGTEEDFINLSEVELDKKYKCFLSKKCNDEKFLRIKKMFEYVKEDPSFIKFIGEEEYKKLLESYDKKERGEIIRIDYDGMNINEVFDKYKLGVKEVLRKGYVLDGDTYKKVIK